MASSPSLSSNIHIISHPVLSSKLSLLRSSSTQPPEFRQLIHDMTLVLGLEASRDLNLDTVTGLQSPLGVSYTGYRIADKVGIAPVLRAGIGMTNAMLLLHPSASIHHLGLYRDAASLQPVEYYAKLPQQLTCDVVYVLDPLVATGGTAVAAVAMLLDWGLKITQIRLLTLVASRPGLMHLSQHHPELRIFVAGVDDELNPDTGRVVPGLGDAGDRLFPDGSGSRSGWGLDRA